MSALRKAGLVVLGLLSVADMATPLLTDGEHPPMAVALVAFGLGVVSLGLVVACLRGARRGVAVLIVLRVLSALAAVPAFFAAEAPTEALVAAGALLVLTVVGVALVLAGGRNRALVPGGAR